MRRFKFPECSLKEKIGRILTEESSERLVEYPLIFAHLGLRRGKILDVGCRYSLLPIQLASLGFETYGIDVHPYRPRHENFTFVRGDIRKTHFPNNFFNLIIAVSTLEHIGLGFYGEEKDERGDLKAVSEIIRILKPKGRLMVTVPFGQEATTSWYRVYSKRRLKKLFRGLIFIKIAFFIKENSIWRRSKEQEAGKTDSSKSVRAIAFIILKKV